MPRATTKKVYPFFYDPGKILMILYEELFRAFEKNKVRYIIVGGIAFNLLGGYRTTLDMDILIDMKDDNIRKVVTILKKAGYHVKQPVDPIQLADKQSRDDWIQNKNLVAFNFYKSDTTFEEVDIILRSVVDYAKAAKRARRVRVGGQALTVISKRDLIKMKQSAGRKVDLSDIKVLRKL